MAMGGRYNYLQSLETSMTLPFGKVLPLFTRRKKKCQNNQKFAFSKQNPAAVKSSEISKIQEFQNSYLRANPCRFSIKPTRFIQVGFRHPGILGETDALKCLRFDCLLSGRIIPLTHVIYRQMMGARRGW
jgi:hypothetical protein